VTGETLLVSPRLEGYALVSQVVDDPEAALVPGGQVASVGRGWSAHAEALRARLVAHWIEHGLPVAADAEIVGGFRDVYGQNVFEVRCRGRAWVVSGLGPDMIFEEVLSGYEPRSVYLVRLHERLLAVRARLDDRAFRARFGDGLARIHERVRHLDPDTADDLVAVANGGKP